MNNLSDKMIFCTLFDSNYLDKGLALYQSMKRHIEDFRLYIFAFDEKCFEILCDMAPENVIVLSVKDIMTDRLREIRLERSRAEFCWTCTSVIIEYVLTQCKEKICTYIDADIYFFSSPVNAIREIIEDNCSVGLVEHRFARDYEYGRQIFRVGKYCIQFNTFLNNEEGLRILREWKEECLNWCYYRYEDGKIGDQKYPDKWKMKYSGVHESHDPGAGVAPWNLHLYSYAGREKDYIYLEYRGRRFPLVFYHFEGMKYLGHHSVFINLWKPAKRGTGRKVRLIYGEYFRNIFRIRRDLYKIYGITFDHMRAEKGACTGKEFSLKAFCEKNGIWNGFLNWTGYWKNNILSDR